MAETYILVDFSSGNDEELMILLPYNPLTILNVITVVNRIAAADVPHTIVIGDSDSICLNEVYCSKLRKYRQPTVFNVLYDDLLIPRELAQLISRLEL